MERKKPRARCKICDKTFACHNTLKFHHKIHLAKRERFQCRFCSNSYLSKQAISEHERLHITGQQLQCKICEKSYNTKNGLKEHMEDHLVLNTVLNCNLCSKTFQKPKYLRKHLYTHTKPRPKPYKCDFPLCQKSFRERGTLLDHSGLHSAIRQFPCSICSRRYQSQNYLAKHIKRIHSDSRLKCPFCRKTFCSKGALERHLRNHTNEKPYKCQLCPDRFMDKSGVTSHQARTHPSSSEPKPEIKCEFCQKVFLMDKYLERHIRNIHQRKAMNWDESLRHRPYECIMCHQRFFTRSALSQHLRAHLQEKPFSCYFCNMRFIGSGNLTSHLTVHTMEKPYQCQVCKMEMSTSHSLRTHQHKHAETDMRTKLSCYFCPRSCYEKANLFRHIRAHCNEYYYSHPCKLCTKSYKFSSSLKQHVTRVHENGSKCYFCKLGFQHAASCAVHLRSHTNEFPYRCRVCRKRFQCNYTLTYHKHPKMKPKSKKF